MIGAIFESLGLSSMATTGTSILATADAAICSDDCFESSSSLMVGSSMLSSTVTPITILDGKASTEKNTYDTVEAFTYIESCSNEEVSDMLNQIDELLDENKKEPEDIKVLGRRL